MCLFSGCELTFFDHRSLDRHQQIYHFDTVPSYGGQKQHHRASSNSVHWELGYGAANANANATIESCWNDSGYGTSVYQDSQMGLQYHQAAYIDNASSPSHPVDSVR